MQRFFSTFPGSWPGLGLLLLRTAAGSASACCGGLYLAYATEPTADAWALGVLGIVSGLALIAGIFTPGAAVAVSTVTFFIAARSTPDGGGGHMDTLAAILMMVNGVALALLGPGAHSIDAYLFGRREIIIPPESASRDNG